ncbi:MAG: hypothetical protein ABWK15_01510 [Dissulfuribacterales bacterium]
MHKPKTRDTQKRCRQSHACFTVPEQLREKRYEPCHHGRLAVITPLQVPGPIPVIRLIRRQFQRCEYDEKDFKDQQQEQKNKYRPLETLSRQSIIRHISLSAIAVSGTIPLP